MRDELAETRGFDSLIDMGPLPSHLSPEPPLCQGASDFLLRSGDRIISRHSTEALAWKAYDRQMRKMTRLLNRPGLHGGLPNFLDLSVERQTGTAPDTVTGLGT